MATVGLATETLAAWLAYGCAARELPCRFAPAETLFGTSSACPVPAALVGHDSFVPGALLALVVVTSAALFIGRLSGIALATTRALRDLRRNEAEVPDRLQSIAADAGCPRAELVLTDEPTPLAYCIGFFRPRVVVSAGLLDSLSDASLRAVLAHESSHRRRRDPLRATLGHSLASALFFVPAIRDLATATVVENEVSADARASDAEGTSNLAAALLVLLNSPSPPGSSGLATDEILQLRLDALESHKRPTLRLKPVRLATSALLFSTVLTTAAWSPHYPASQILRSPSHATQGSSHSGHTAQNTLAK